jgi:hypothetical protein
MKKMIGLLVGGVFLFGLTLSSGFGQYKKEKESPLNPIPPQNTIHLEKTDDKKLKEMQKEIDMLKSQQKAPAAAQTAAPPAAAVTAAPPAAPAAAADTKAPSKDKKKTKKSKKEKKDKTN